MVEIHDVNELKACLAGDGIVQTAIQDLDLRGMESLLEKQDVTGTVFLGCRLGAETVGRLVAKGATVLSNQKELPFNPFRGSLYSHRDLFDNFDPADPCTYCQTLDARCYRYWAETGRSDPEFVGHAIMRSLHDLSMSDALGDFLQKCKDKPTAAIMGGHSLKRTSDSYRQICLIAKGLAEAGYLLVSGGGPGGMEATHLGALMAGHDVALLDRCLEALAPAPGYKDKEWLACAYRALELIPKPHTESLGIPTWLYGHEPPTPFATHIAKFFNNSLREEGLITVAHDGIVFAPGSAGTIQEIFQDAAQNHYTTTGKASPMVFLNKYYWQVEKPVYPILQQLACGQLYGKLLAIYDEPSEVVNFLLENKALEAEKKGWSFCGDHCAES